MLPLMLATQTRAILQSSSAEKPAYPLAITVGSVDLRLAVGFSETPILSLGIAQVSAKIHEHCSPLLRSAVSSNIATG